jgi:hypothetical protein
VMVQQSQNVLVFRPSEGWREVVYVKEHVMMYTIITKFPGYNKNFLARRRVYAGSAEVRCSVPNSR